MTAPPSCPTAEPPEAGDDVLPSTAGAPAVPALAPLVLVGMMGAGKTTIGRALARVLGRRFVDIDHMIEARCGVRIPTIFELEGEPGFRRRETVALDECSRQADVVLATGGGAVLAEANRAMLRERGTVVYLRARPEELYQRTCHDKNRPLLQTADPLARIAELVAQREPLYESVAHLVIDTGRVPVSRLVNRLIPLLAEHERPAVPAAGLPPLEQL